MVDAKIEPPRPRRPAIGTAIEPIEISEATLVVPPKSAPDNETTERGIVKDAPDLGSRDAPVEPEDSESVHRPSRDVQGPGVVGRPPMDELAEKLDVVFEVPRLASNRLRVALIAVLAVTGLYLFFSGPGVPEESGSEARSAVDIAIVEESKPTNVAPSLALGSEVSDTEVPGTELPGTEVPGTEVPGTEVLGSEGLVPVDATGVAGLEIADVDDTAADAKRKHDEVRMTFRILPSHARMVVNGKTHQGDLVVPRGPDEYVVIFSAKGYEEQVFRLTGERSVSIDVELTKAPKKRRVRHRGR
ncbi:MAG: hypothetical protein IPK13_11440 [Deltaproteobacteria bacterium]|nr:hypothetical protein [Deltaproteobacteria bacterium]